MNKGSKVFLATNGCPENRIDLARMGEFLIENKWKVVNSVEESDLILFNACALTNDTQESSIKIISELNLRKKPSTEFIVCGCLPKINNRCLREIYQSTTFGSDEIEGLAEALKINKNPENIHANYLVPHYKNGHNNRLYIKNLNKLFSMRAVKSKLYSHYFKELRYAVNVYHPYSYCIKISTGCLMNCTYCAVKISRGTLKSKPLNKVVNEFEEGLARGFKEFSLIGTDTGSYGRDQGITLVTLLNELLAMEGDYRIRLRNVQPKYLIEMMPKLKELFKSKKIDYLSTAAQSGNNRILRLMNRKYTIEEFKEIIKLINIEFPYIQIRTQIMVGFPSETEEEYHDSVRLLDELKFDFIETFLYSPRPNTDALKIKEKVSKSEAGKRYSELRTISLFNQIKRKNKNLKIYKKELNKWRQKSEIISKTIEDVN